MPPNFGCIMEKTREKRMSSIMVLHYIKLAFRSLLFIAALIIYIFNRVYGTGGSFGGFEQNNILLGCIWAIFMIEMVLRFFPSRVESMGCQKQFARNFKETDFKGERKMHSGKTTFAVAVLWLLLNSVIGLFYLCGIFDRGIMLLIALFYSVCDVICILFFCPFQTWIMKNKCCGSCRIYNWDYAMMFTPLLFVINVYSWTLLGAAVMLLIRWENAAWRHPERFMEKTNNSLSCKMCREKLCQHKTQLRSFLKKRRFNAE